MAAGKQHLGSGGGTPRLPWEGATGVQAQLGVFQGRPRVNHTHSCSSFSKTQAYLPQPYPAPTPKLQQPPRTLVREAQAAALPIWACWGWGPCMPPPTPTPSSFPIAATSHPLSSPHGQGSRLRRDAHLFWKAISSRGSKMFSSGSHVLYLASEKGGGIRCKKRGGGGRFGE